MPRAAVLATEPFIRWRRIGLPAAFLLLGVAATLMAIALWSRTLIAHAETPRLGQVEVALADRRLSVPRAWLVHAESARPVERLVLQAPLRDVLDVDTIPARLTIGLAIAVADDAPPPSERPALLYNRFLVAGAESTADGLIRRAFDGSSPYQGEVLFLAPPQGRAFSARCLDGEAAAGVRLPCLAELRRAGLDVQVRLPREGLVYWSRIVAAVDRMTPPPGG